ncbi:glycerophosphodiester phosphodiesterase [Agromyces sp. NPDC056523]|uniref:glycerophosphodiester phosphodiesterase n=1 Tax=Agromyces sp. NPDC056523 TaxID=3345850 RepID=UPI0036712B72
MRRAPDAVDPATTAPARVPPIPRTGHLTAPPRPVVRAALAGAGVAAMASLLWTVSTPTDVYAIDVFGALRQPGEAAAIIGHRGDRSMAPENTMPALELAMDDLAYVETDVRLTRDGVPVLFHDTDLERIAGRHGRIEDLDHADVARLDVGGWYADEWSGERVPTLDAFLAALAEREGARALVELKAAWRPDEVRRVVDLVEVHGLRGRVVLQSFSIETMQSIQRVAPTVPRIMLIRELPADPVPMAEHFGVIGFGTTAASVTAAPEAVDLAHAAGIAVLCYTLNTQDTWAQVSALGVDGIITDQPSDLDAWIATTAPGT